MFEGTLVESRGQLGSPAVRWTAAGSVLVQVGIAAVLVLIPMLRPETLEMLERSPELVAPIAPPKPPVVMQVRTASAADASAAMSVPAQVARVESGAGRMRQLLLGPMGMQDPGPGMVGPMGMPGGTGLDALARVGNGSGSGTAVVRAAERVGPVRVSSGVSAGMLVSQIVPAYPAIAKAAGVEGTVVVEAVITKVGKIASARAVSGPPLLRGAAVDAVSGARYRPYALNGQPVEVQTSVVVNFRLR
jgi:protein TonB